MRLFKLAAYALFGYALFEFIRGIINDEAASGGPERRVGTAGGKGRIGKSGAAQNITGPGEGEDVETVGSDGGAMRHRVGRGVVR